jgi:hypothetical protein
MRRGLSGFIALAACFVVPIGSAEAAGGWKPALYAQSYFGVTKPHPPLVSTDATSHQPFNMEFRSVTGYDLGEIDVSVPISCAYGTATTRHTVTNGLVTARNMGALGTQRVPVPIGSNGSFALVQHTTFASIPAIFRISGRFAGAGASGTLSFDVPKHSTPTPGIWASCTSGPVTWAVKWYDYPPTSG